MNKKFRYYSVIFLTLIGVLFACQNPTKSEKSIVGKAKNENVRDLAEILQSNKLVVIAENSAISYFIYKGQKMGLEYEILQRFAKDMGVKLEVKVIDNLDHIIDDLQEGVGDLIACNYTITKNRRQEIDFSIPHLLSSQVLVQKKPVDWRSLSKAELENSLIRRPEELSKKEVHVWKNSSYYDRLINLQNELGDTVAISPLNGDIIPEKAMEMVDKEFIKYTVLDQNVARMNQNFHPDLDIDLELSIQQRIAFGVRKSSPNLRKKLDEWLEDFMKTVPYKYIKHKYLNTSTYASRSNSEFSSVRGSKISPYDNTIKTISEKYKWDWRLIASIIYQESKFIEGLESFAGAYGVMQFIPSVGPSYGVYPDSPLEIQIDGGIRKFGKDYKDWASIPDSIQRVKFALASYNAGKGHVLDAQRLAEKYNRDPLLWDDNVEVYMQLLSDPKYFRDPVSLHGYTRGSETYNFVRDIISRYEEYKNSFD